MIEKELPRDFHRIRSLFIDLSAAWWERINAADDPCIAIEKENGNVFPKSPKEIAVWDDLTSPENHDALGRYVGFWAGNVTTFSKNLFNALVEESNLRAAGHIGRVNRPLNRD